MFLSPLQKSRLEYKPKIPALFAEIEHLELTEAPLADLIVDNEIAVLFPKTKDQKKLIIKRGSYKTGSPLRIGVVFSGGQAPGGHNVIAGIFDALRKRYPGSVLYGFLGGPSGILEGKSLEITEAILVNYRNQGGFDLLGSGRTKIDKPEQFIVAARRMQEMSLDGLVVIGGDDSNTNAALLAEYFVANDIATTVVGVPKTIDGDLRGHGIEVSFGFDTACKNYSATIGSLSRDALSAKKYTFFVKLMGRSASHVTLECAMRTHPNLALISEEIAAKKIHLSDIVEQIASMVMDRSRLGKEYGVVLIPEGVIEFVVDMKLLIDELNRLLSHDNFGAAKLDSLQNSEEKIASITSLLSTDARNCFIKLPEETKLQLLLERDPHGNVQVSKIETERMFISMVQNVLKEKGFTGKFSPQPIFCGYEGRSCLPSNFDADYCYTLGYVAVLLVGAKKTGYVCSVEGLSKGPDMWTCGAIPLVSLMTMEKRMGKKKPVIEKSLVDISDLHGLFAAFVKQRDRWATDDQYVDPGPIQFFGPKDIVDSVPLLVQ